MTIVAAFAAGCAVPGDVPTEPATGQTAQAVALPLLDRAAIRAPFAAACDGKPDATLLPVDPRSLVVPGINRPGTAVQFNAFWTDLHAPPAPYRSTLPQRPRTCGEFRAAVSRGRSNILTRAYFQPFSTGTGYYNLYKQWGYTSRPADFDQQVQRRYGLTSSDWANPYPLPGENPATTNGGTGKLPLGLVQNKDASGKYNGLISSTCSGCHDSRLGTPGESPFTWGRANDAGDAGLLQTDLFHANNIAFLDLAPLPWSVGRGGSDAIGIIDLLPALFDMDTLGLVPSLLEFFPTGAAGMTKAPNWWYRAFKTRQFWDGALTSDNVRSEMAFGIANLLRNGPQRRALTTEFEDNNAFLLSLSPPQYTGAIDTALAEQGAVLFHERDLWANGANAGIPRTPGNGSCASCHGVYAPRYAADPAFLPDVRLKGVSGMITPIETLGTDPARMGLMADQRKRRAWNSSYLAYNDESPLHLGYFDDPISSALRRIPRAAYDNALGPVFSPLGKNEWIVPFGYFAPPMYGAWAAAPYFHNGSVPDLWGVLKPSDRPALWKRMYTPTNDRGTNAGYDNSLASYDFQRLGWKYTALTCSNTASSDPFLPCSNDMATIDILFANIANAIGKFNSLAYQSPPPVTEKQVRSRMIFNTHLYGMGKQGHEFTQSLTDAERWAILEYLKTL